MLSYTLINIHSQVRDPGPSCLSSFLNADFSKSTFSKKSFSLNTIECQTVWTQFRTDIMLVLTWVQTVCKVKPVCDNVGFHLGRYHTCIYR